MTTILENLTDACNFLNQTFRTVLKRHNIKTIKTIGVYESDMLIEFDEVLRTLDRMHDIIIPANLVDFYNDKALDMLKTLDEKEETNEEAEESNSESEENDTEEIEETEEEELGEEATNAEDKSQDKERNEENYESSDTKEDDREIDSHEEEAELGESVEDSNTSVSKDFENKEEGGTRSGRRSPPSKSGPRKVVMPGINGRKRTTPTGDYQKNLNRRRPDPVPPRHKKAEKPKNETTEKPKNDTVGVRRTRTKGKNIAPKSKPVEKSRVVDAETRPTEESKGLYTLLDRKAVLAELKRIGPKKPKKDTSSVELIAIRNGDLISYNQKKALLYKMPDDSMSMDFGLNAYAFKQALEAIKTNEVSLTENKNNIMVTGGKISITLHKFKDDYISSLYESLGVRRAMNQFKPIPTGFLSGLAYCTEVATKDADNLRMLHTIKVSDEMMYANAGYQSIRCRITDNAFDTFFLLKESADQILQFKPQTYFVNRQWAHFQNTDDTILSVRLYMQQQGEMFMDTDELFQSIEEGFAFGSGIDAKNLKDLAKFAGKDGMQVKIKEDGTAIFTASSTTGRMTLSTTVVDFKENKPIQFNIDPLILIMCIGAGRIHVSSRSLQMSTEAMDYIIALFVEN